MGKMEIFISEIRPITKAKTYDPIIFFLMNINTFTDCFNINKSCNFRLISKTQNYSS